MSRCIYFRTDMEEQPVVLNLKTYADSFMKEPIDNALERFDRISRRNSVTDWELNGNSVSPNNVIAFVGDRGTGKTSCMLSVMKIRRELEDLSVLQGGHELERNYFMELVDPSFFDKEHNILDILIGKMYAEFRKKTESVNLDHAKLRALLDCFKKVKDCLKFLGRGIDYDNDSLDELNGLAAGVDLRSAFHKLVEKYTGLFGARRLVIPIDDIDLNTEQAFEMMELIRKYIVQPNTIILFAVKIPQLTNSVKLKLTQQYTPIVGADNQMKMSEISLMAERYVDKFLPINGRIYMPATNAVLSQPVCIMTGDNVRAQFTSAADAVLQLIFSKTRYLFYNSEGRYSHVIPRRLRELRQLIMLLFSLPHYDSAVSMNSDSETGRTNASNKTVFKNYFFNAIVDSLPQAHREIASQIFEARDFSTFNKMVIALLRQFGKEHYYDLSVRTDIEHNTESELSMIINQANVPYNISLGDVMLSLNNINGNQADNDLSDLIFFIKSYYSILLYELYDQRCDDILAPRDTAPIEKPRLQNQLLKGVGNLRRLVGGAYFTLTDNVFLPPEKEKVSRERILVNGDMINARIRDLKEFWMKIKDAGLVDNLQNPETLPQELVDNLIDFGRDLRTIELFMIGVQRYISFRDEDYRLQHEVYYNRDLSNTKNLVFDVTAPFFNLLDIRSAYERFDKDIFAICREFSFGEFRSLYSLLYDRENATELSPEEEHRFLSKATIRNIEIMEDLSAFIERHRDGRLRQRQGRSLAYIYALFYQTVDEYTALSYHKDLDKANGHDDTNYHKIKLSPFNVLYKILNLNDHEAKWGINPELFALITDTTDMLVVSDTVLQARKRFSREEIINAINSNLPDQFEDPDFDTLFYKSFTKEYGDYSISEITNKFVRLQEKTGARLERCLDPVAANMFRGKLKSKEDNHDAQASDNPQENK